MFRLPILALLVLAACSTPRERCIAGATRDIRVLSGLIATTRGNINRGYAIVTEEFLETEEQVCGVVDGQEVFCDVPVANSRDVPQAIDLNAEQAKLNSLLQKRSELEARSNAVSAECRLLHPES